jgi:hypothetical protein
MVLRVSIIAARLPFVLARERRVVQVCSTMRARLPLVGGSHVVAVSMGESQVRWRYQKTFSRQLPLRGAFIIVLTRKKMAVLEGPSACSEFTSFPDVLWLDNLREKSGWMMEVVMRLERCLVFSDIPEPCDWLSRVWHKLIGLQRGLLTPHLPCRLTPAPASEDCEPPTLARQPSTTFPVPDRPGRGQVFQAACVYLRWFPASLPGKRSAREGTAVQAGQTWRTSKIRPIHSPIGCPIRLSPIGSLLLSPISKPSLISWPPALTSDLIPPRSLLCTSFLKHV